MRLTGHVLMALVLLLAGAAPIEAGVGLPEIGWIQIGPYWVHVLNDSIGLREGLNTLTVHVPDLPPAYSVTLHLLGPQGEAVEVPLRPLLVLGSSSADHASHTAAPVADPSSDHSVLAPVDQVRDLPHDVTSDHASAGGPALAEAAPRGAAPGDHHSHGVAVPGTRADGHVDHGEAAVSQETASHGEVPHGAGHRGVALGGYAVRGTARLPTTGTWQAVLTLEDGQREPLSGDFRVDVTAGGPNSLYLGLMGLLTSGSVLYGVIQRKRRAGRA